MQPISNANESSFFDAIIEQAQREEQEKTASIDIAGHIAVDRMIELSSLLQQYSSGVSETGAAPEQAREKMDKVMKEMLNQMRIIKKHYQLHINP